MSNPTNLLRSHLCRLLLNFHSQKRSYSSVFPYLTNGKPENISGLVESGCQHATSFPPPRNPEGHRPRLGLAPVTLPTRQAGSDPNTAQASSSLVLETSQLVSKVPSEKNRGRPIGTATATIQHHVSSISSHLLGLMSFLRL